MRKLMCLFAFLMVVPLMSFSQRPPDAVTMTLPRKDIRDILMTVRQSSVQDTVNVPARTEAIRSMVNVMRSSEQTGTITLPTEYVLTYLERQAYQLMEYERYAKERNKALRIISELQKADPRLISMREDVSQPGRFFQIYELRKIALKEFRKEAAAVKKSYSVEKEEEDDKVIVDDVK